MNPWSVFHQRQVRQPQWIMKILFLLNLLVYQEKRVDDYEAAAADEAASSVDLTKPVL